MKYFLDTEFMENGPYAPITLLSIALVCEDGRELYLVNLEADHKQASGWVKANVLPCLALTPSNGGTLPTIRERIREFVGSDVPTFFGYYADYDWVVFCQIFGAMIDLPERWPMFCNDLKQWCDQLGSPRLPPQSSTEHNALNDARWNRLAWDFLNGPDHAVATVKESLTVDPLAHLTDNSGMPMYRLVQHPDGKSTVERRCDHT